MAPRKKPSGLEIKAFRDPSHLSANPCLFISVNGYPFSGEKTASQCGKRYTVVECYNFVWTLKGSRLGSQKRMLGKEETPQA